MQHSLEKLKRLIKMKRSYSEETPLTAVAVHNIAQEVLKRHGYEGVFQLVVGEVPTVGERMLDDKRLVWGAIGVLGIALALRLFARRSPPSQ